MKTLCKNATTKLEKAVQKIINKYAADYESGAEGFMKDLRYGGCQSGLVGELIYYNDTCRFYNQHKQEINALLYETLENCGLKSPAELFGDKWDEQDPMGIQDQNQNLLAWFAFEETAMRLLPEE